MKYRHSLSSFVNRIAAVLKPAVRTIPADVDAILSTTRGSDLIQQFNDFYYASRGNLRWRGINLIKNPCDLWTMVDLIDELKPGLIIETGTAEGGSATFYRDMTDIRNIDTQIVTVDINPKWGFDPATRRIISLVGYSTDTSMHAEIMRHVEAARARGRAVIVCLDSDHSANNVSRELELYSAAVTVGSYCVVEDTNVNGHPSYPDHGPGPWEAAQSFVRNHPEFEIDVSRQSYLLTYNPSGYLRRTR